MKERQQRQTTQLDEFQDIGAQLFIIVLSELHAPQEGKKEITENMVEHPVTHDLMAS